LDLLSTYCSERIFLTKPLVEVGGPDGKWGKRALGQQPIKLIKM
jgi:hypothetical protein